MPEDVFRQEYMAEFLEDSAGVFRNVDACLLGGTPKRTDDVVIGCDLAKHTDHTVLVAMDRRTGHCLDMDRFNHLDWPIQKERIVSFYRKYNGLLIIDATGIGDPIYDDLRHVVPRIEPVKLTNLSKTQLIQRLIVAVEQREIAWPAAWTVLTDEMKRYEYKITANGSITYNAPSSYHDDCVIALALANSKRYAFEGSGDIRIIQPVPKAARLWARGRVLVG
jgi:phage FluMu gp28-like protein